MSMYALRRTDNGYVPADAFSESRLRKMHKPGVLVFATLKRPRNPGFHRLAHQLGALIAQNIEEFRSLEPHEVLKRLQIESGAGCEYVMIRAGGENMAYHIPKSLAYESMDQAQFKTLMARLCTHVSEVYWPSIAPEHIERMAELWVEPT